MVDSLVAVEDGLVLEDNQAVVDNLVVLEDILAVLDSQDLVFQLKDPFLIKVCSIERRTYTNKLV